jgi:carbon-monoxide dehydrogenase iron sulfur subunit
MQMTLMVDPEKCTGCRLCELACSIKHENVANPNTSRVHIVKWMIGGVYIPMVCQQCDSPVCEAVCPVNATFRDPETGAMMIDYDKCIGCRMCVVYCPFGGAGLDVRRRKTIKCDLCDGDPMCVKFCRPEALQYVAATATTLRRKRAAAEKFSELMKKLLTP